MEPSKPAGRRGLTETAVKESLSGERAPSGRAPVVGRRLYGAASQAQATRSVSRTGSRQRPGPADQSTRWLKQSRAVATCYDKHGSVLLGTITAAALVIRLR